MIYSLRHKFLFIHIFKTGGTSIYKALESGLYEYEKQYNHLINHLGTAHNTAQMIKDEIDRIDINLWDKLFKFTFVRNTWDWQVSCYHQLKQPHMREKDGNYDWIKSFRQYLDLRLNDDGRLPADYLKTQKDFITVDGGLDFIGRTENMNSDFIKICQRLNKKVCNVGKFNTTQIEVNGKNFPRPHYREYYNTETAKLVRDYFVKDIDYFNFTYE